MPNGYLCSKYLCPFLGVDICTRQHPYPWVSTMVDICIHIVPIYLEKNRFFICICGYLFGLGPHLLYLHLRLAVERHIRGYNYSYLLKSVSGDTEQNSNPYLYLLSVCNPTLPPTMAWVAGGAPKLLNELLNQDIF